MASIVFWMFGATLLLLLLVWALARREEGAPGNPEGGRPDPAATQRREVRSNWATVTAFLGLVGTGAALVITVTVLSGIGGDAFGAIMAAVFGAPFSFAGLFLLAAGHYLAEGVGARKVLLLVAVGYALLAGLFAWLVVATLPHLWNASLYALLLASALGWGAVAAYRQAHRLSNRPAQEAGLPPSP